MSEVCSLSAISSPYPPPPPQTSALWRKSTSKFLLLVKDGGRRSLARRLAQSARSGHVLFLSYLVFMSGELSPIPFSFLGFFVRVRNYDAKGERGEEGKRERGRGEEGKREGMKGTGVDTAE